MQEGTAGHGAGQASTCQAQQGEGASTYAWHSRGGKMGRPRRHMQLQEGHSRGRKMGRPRWHVLGAGGAAWSMFPCSSVVHSLEGCTAQQRHLPTLLVACSCIRCAGVLGAATVLYIPHIGKGAVARTLSHGCCLLLCWPCVCCTGVLGAATLLYILLEWSGVPLLTWLSNLALIAIAGTTLWAVGARVANV